MSDTPETDEAYLTHGHDDCHRIDNMLAVSEKLERERDEARALAEIWRDIGLIGEEGYNHEDFKWETK